MSECDCAYKQYCNDCREEMDDEEEEVTTHSSSYPRDNQIIISGDNLYHKGRRFQIVKEENKDPNRRIETKEGFIFYTRIEGEKIIFIKFRRFSKDGKRPTCEERLCKLLIGKIPHQLVEDLDW